MNIYYAIRELSDLKEKSNVSSKEISSSENKLKKLSNNITYLSEASLLARMNWWTVEYGLVGSIDNAKIYGAGLLSSVGESENCINKKIKKIPFNLDCINYDYNITEQQPQLFVTPNYKFLSNELKKFSKKMAYKKGGEYGIKEAIKAKTICSIEVDKLIQISGIVERYMINKNGDIYFIKLSGPSQICYKYKEIDSHGADYHNHGYSTPLGKLKEFNKPIHKLNNKEKSILKLAKKNIVTLSFKDGISLVGKIKRILKRDSRIILITFTNCTILKNKLTIFDPTWGNFDLISGSKITSVFGGPSDSINYYKKIKTKKSRYKRYNIQKKITKEDSKLNNFFKLIKQTNKNNINELLNIYNKMKKNKINDWLLKYEFLEKTNCNLDIPWIKTIFDDLNRLSSKNSDLSRAIKRSLNLFS